MSTKLLVLSLVTIVTLSLLSYKVTYALFSNSAESSANTFAAAAVFPTPTIAPGDVVINEINWAGNNEGGGTNDEWIELRNTTSNAINIGGWVVENLGTSVSPNITISPSTASISANGFFLISNKNKSASKINVDPDMITASVSLTNDGEQLRLKTDLGTLIDTANASPGAWLAGVNTPEPKKSMERKTPPGDGTVAGNWQTATTHTNMDGAGVTDEFGTPKANNGL